MRSVKINNEWTLITESSAMIQFRSQSYENVLVYLGENPSVTDGSFIMANNQIFSTTSMTKVWAKTEASGIAIVKEV